MTLDRIVLAFVLVWLVAQQLPRPATTDLRPVQASYDGHAFTPKFGSRPSTRARPDRPRRRSDHCGSEKLANRERQRRHHLDPTLTAGIYSTRFVQVSATSPDYESVGTRAAVDVTAVTTSVTATVNFTFHRQHGADVHGQRHVRSARLRALILADPRFSV